MTRADCPCVPDGATEHETALIATAWQTAHDTYAQIARSATWAAERLAAGEDPEIQDRGGIAADGARAIAALAETKAHIEATLRRLGWNKHPYTGEWTPPNERMTSS